MEEYMHQRFKTIKGFFGQFIHYKDGIKVGESWSSIFADSYTHYDTDGRYNGYSDPGLFGSRVHHNEFGGRTGETWTDAFGVSRHYSVDKEYVGSSYEGFIGRTTYIVDSPDTPFASQVNSPCGFNELDDFTTDESFDGNDW